MLAYMAGLVTLFNPCVLPILPVVLGAAFSQNRYGAVALTAGIVTSFTSFGFVVVAFGYSIGLSEVVMRNAAAALLIAAGLVLLVPVAQGAFTAATARLGNNGNRLLSRLRGDGVSGQFLIGLLLGVVWAPCVGPTLGAAIALASRGENLLQAYGSFLLFGAGVASAMLLFAYGSRQAVGTKRLSLRKIARYARPVFGALVLSLGVLVLTGADKALEERALALLPDWWVRMTTHF